MIRLLALAALAWAGVAEAQNAYFGARSAGQVGERYDGYLGYSATPLSPQARSQTEAINIRRRALYTDLATRRGVSPYDVGVAAGCNLLARVEVGESYMLQDGQWRRRAPGQAAPVPDYCGAR